MLDLTSVVHILQLNVAAPVSSRLVISAVVTVMFAVLARAIHGVNNSGAIAGAIASFALLIGAGPAAFLALVAVFALTWAATRLGYSRKLKWGTAEKKAGRAASQVLANLAVAAGCALFYEGFDHRSVFLIMVFAALSEAAADTVSSEVGQASSNRARLITNWKQVPAGTDGGITITGTLAGIAAACLVSSIAFATRLPPSSIAISILSATIGMFADSFLGGLL
jgi:uncharacterized protein (TIGR00297 family)